MAADPKPKQDLKLLTAIYKEMLFYRRFEERANQAYQKGKFSGFCHLHIGQEAVCVGVARNLRDTDYVISGYRSHTQAIAKGIEPRAVLAELFGKVGGTCGGKGGSMHMFSREKRFLGGHGIVGGQCPIAAGVGFAIRYENKDDVIVCYLGDAATNQGQFFEAMNMAATWQLPVLYIVENNQYGMGTAINRVTSVDHLWKRALAFDMDHSDVDGMDVIKVYEHVGQILERMRKSPRPYFLEALTYRYRGHSVSDPATYRTKEEVKKFQDRDPITQLGVVLKSLGATDDEQLKAYDKEVRNRVKEAEAFADESPRPDVASAYEHVYCD
jgi:pyruvate dehydrogenase E1 component alpha subunit